MVPRDRFIGVPSYSWLTRTSELDDCKGKAWYRSVIRSSPSAWLTSTPFSVQSRLTSQQGISFTEFTYQLLQAYDFYVLNKNEGCTIQIGGSDQWGNIVAGIDLINKLDAQQQNAAEKCKEKQVFAVTTPLLTTPSGQKFGKSAGNAIALDESVTSVFDFYQVCVVVLR